MSGENRRIRVMLVDDQTLFREALEQALNLEEDLEVVASASNGREALAEAQRLRPDVVLMDLKMPELDGIRATEQIKQSQPECRVLMLTLFGDEEYLHRAILAGADGYLLKDIRRVEMVEAIRQAFAGRCLIDPSLMRSVMQQYVRLSRGEKMHTSYPDGLTEREVEVLSLLAEGYPNKRIAEKLLLTVGTVKQHLSNIYEKIGVNDRTQAALYFIRKGL